MCLWIHHAVLGLEIAVGDALLMHVGHGTQQLPEVVQSQLLWHPIVALLDVVQQIWAPHQLKLRDLLVSAVGASY